MVWEPCEEAWETKLAGLRSYQRAHGHLAPRQDAAWGEDGEQLAVGQLMANLRRRGGLGKDEERATRAQQLTAIDEDWACPWPLDWQRHHRVLAQLAETEPGGLLPAIEPGVLLDGDDLGRWLTQQIRHWAQLSAEQQERLTALGVTPAPAPAAVPAAGPGGEAKGGSGKSQRAFQRGLTALTQWMARKGADRPVPRGHAEPITVDGEAAPVIVKLGVWISNTRARRDKLDQAQLGALAELGVE